LYPFLALLPLGYLAPFTLHNSRYTTRRSALATYERLGRAEEAAALRAELAVFARYIGDATA
jgi:hypothetical protein